jgi:hypothetical protein
VLYSLRRAGSKVLFSNGDAGAQISKIIRYIAVAFGSAPALVWKRPAAIAPVLISVEIQFIVASDAFLHFFVIRPPLLTYRQYVYSTQPIALRLFFHGSFIFCLTRQIRLLYSIGIICYAVKVLHPEVL